MHQESSTSAATDRQAGPWLRRPTPRAASRGRSRLLRVAAWALAALLLVWLLSWLALPPLLKWQLQTRGSAYLGRELRVERVRVVPMTLQLTLEGLSLGAAPGADDAAPQLQVRRLFVDLDARSLLRRAPVIAALELDAPQLRVVRLVDGSLDIDDLLQRLAAVDAPAASSAPLPFALFNLRIADGALSLDDRPAQRKHELRELQLDLPFISSLPADLQVRVEPRLSFEFDGSQLRGEASATPFAEGRASQLKLGLDALALQPLWVYLPARLPLQPVGGELSAELTLHFEQPRAEPPRLQLRGWIELDDLQLQASSAQLLGWRKLRLQIAELDLPQRRVALESLQLDAAQLDLRREASGRLELQRVFDTLQRTQPSTAPAPAASAPVAIASAAPPAPTRAAAAPAAQTPGWQWRLDRLQLRDAQLRWSDATLQPAAELQLHDLQLELEQLRWPFDTDARLQLSAVLGSPDRVQGQISAEGSFRDRQAGLQLRLKNVDLALAQAYLRPWLRAQASATLDASVALDWQDAATPRLLLAVPALEIEALRLREAGPAAAAGPSLQIARLQLQDAQADLLRRQIKLGRVLLQRPKVALSRGADGRLDLERWWTLPLAADRQDRPDRPGGAPGSDEAGAAGPAPWTLGLQDLRLSDGELRWRDAVLAPTRLRVSDLQLAAQDLSWPGGKPAPLQLGLRLHTSADAPEAPETTAARLDWRGELGLAPASASAQGRLRLQRLPVHVFQPYFGAALPLSLQRLEAGFDGELELRQGAADSGALQARVQGDALLADLRLHARAAPGTELLRWNALQLQGLKLDLRPPTRPRLEVGELKLADFFARLQVDEQGRLNLQTLAAAPAASAASAPSVMAAASAASAPSVMAAASAASVPVAAARPGPQALPFDLVIGSTRFSNGHVDFDDRFVRPNYRAELTGLDGSMGRLDSGTRAMAQLQIGGRVGGSGSLQIEGALNPAVRPPALDLRARATDIALPALTPYAAKYAGYPIRSGELDMELAYRVDADGALTASNRIVVKQLSLGPRSDSPQATQLPVPLLLALLQDSRGVIDLDLPLSGSLSDPQFSIAGLVWKVLGNLFGKILSAPFAALGGGSSEADSGRIEFSPGSAQLTPAAVEQVARLAQALAARPGLRLSLVASADAQAEGQAMRQAAMEARLRELQRRERARAGLGRADLDAPLPPLTEQQRVQLLRQLYAESTLADKPRNLIGLPKDIPPAEMEVLLRAAQPLDEGAAQQLARQRGLAVRDALLTAGLGSERLTLAEPRLQRSAGAAAPAQVTLSLSAR